MGSRRMLIAVNRQIRGLPDGLEAREHALCELAREYARNFDAGHTPSGTQLERALDKLRKLAECDSPRAPAADTAERSRLDDLAARRAARLADAADREPPAVGHE